MIEMIIVFVFGVLLALIIGFLISPILWRRAEKAALNRVEGTMPLLSAEIEAEKDSYRAEYALKLLQVERELEAERASRLQAERNRTQSEKSTNEMKKDFHQKIAQTQQLQTSLSSVQSELVASENHVLELTRQNRDLLIKQSEEEIKVADLQSTLNKRDITIDTLQNNISDIQKDLDHTKKDLEKTQNDNKTLGADKEANESKLQTDIDALTKALNEARADATAAHENGKALESRLSEYVNKARDQGEQINKLKETLRNQESAFATLSKNYTKAEEQLTLMREKTASDNKAETQHNEELAQLHRERKTFENSLKKLARERDQAIADNNYIKNSSAELEKARANEIEALRQSLDTLGKQKISLQSKFEETLDAVKRAGLEVVENDNITDVSQSQGHLRIQERGSNTRSPLH